MKKTVLIAFLVGFVLLLGTSAMGEEYEEFSIKYGMHEDTVKEKYGEPLYSKNIKVNPIPIKKVLYERGESEYMILHFYSGRIYKIVLLEDMDLDEVRDIFERSDKG
ncbi:MAG: hypothetical protein ABH875_05385 [Candidatus Omnitrophota bacterium]